MFHKRQKYSSAKLALGCTHVDWPSLQKTIVLIIRSECATQSQITSLRMCLLARSIKVCNHSRCLVNNDEAKVQVVVVVNHCFASLSSTNGLLSDIVIRLNVVVN